MIRTTEPAGLSVEWPLARLSEDVKRALRAGLQSGSDGDACPALTDADWRRLAGTLVVTVARIRGAVPDESSEPLILRDLLGVVRRIERALRDA